jgi:hypothetical protein
MNTLKKRTGCLAGLALAAAFLALPGLASAATYYVSTTGDDTTGDGSSGNPWKTITHAAATVPAGSAGTPNIISVAAGTYDNTTNGETFPITFTRSFVSLTGAGAATTIIDPEEINTSDALHVDATGFSVSGFTFQNMSDADAIVITEGGFTISNNVFDTTVNDGVSFYRPSETDRTTSVSFADMAITNNTFKTRQNGVYVSLEIDFDDTVSGLTATFGNFTISGNTFPLTSGDGIYISNLFSPQDITNGTVTAGNLTVTGNTVTGGDTGIYFYSYVYYMENTQLSVGNVVVSNNTCTNQSSYGIYLYNWEFEYFYGTTNATLGNFTVSGNTVEATDYATYPNTNGIYLDYMDYISYMYDETTVTTGAISVTNNTVDVDDYGIYFYSYGIWDIGEDAGDSVAVTTGTRTISGNTINSNDYYGLYLDLDYIGYDMYGTSTVDYGNLNISNNTITSYYEAFYFYCWYEAGYYMYNDAQATLGSVTISGNSLTSSGDDAIYYNLEYIGYEMYGNSAATFGPTSITNNTLTAGSGYGIYFYFYETPTYMYDNATFAMGNFTIDDNTINATGGDGINVYYYDYYVGSYMEGNSVATLPGWIITDNTIDVTGGNDGIEFYTYSNPDDNYDQAAVHFGSMRIDNNTFNPDKNAGMDYGIYFWIEDLVEGAYGPTTTTFGNITITDNRFYAVDSEAIYLGYDDVGYYFDDAAILTVGDIEIGSNTIDMAPIGIDAYFYDLYTNDSASVTIGKLNIHDNTLTNISDYGISVYYYNVNDDPGTATLSIGAPTISGNTISGVAAKNEGIYLYVDNSTEGITFGMPTISGNTVSGFNQGIYLEGLEEASLSCNFLENNASVGMRFNTAGTNFAVHDNSIVGNHVGLLVDDGQTAVINAEKNWWGDKLGPAACASCNRVDPGDSGTVDFTPWLTSQPQKFSCGAAFPWILFIPAITGMGI